MLPSYKGHAIIYIGKPDEGKEAGVSPEVQLEACVQTCSVRNWSYELCHDVAHWRGNAKRLQPGWIDLKDRLAQGGVSAVVVYRLDRESENPKGLFSLMADLGKLEVDVLTAVTR